MRSYTEMYLVIGPAVFAEGYDDQYKVNLKCKPIPSNSSLSNVW
jgi:hypothetical protein